jgi:hypothetical protein
MKGMRVSDLNIDTFQRQLPPNENGVVISGLQCTVAKQTSVTDITSLRAIMNPTGKTVEADVPREDKC